MTIEEIRTRRAALEAECEPLLQRREGLVAEVDGVDAALRENRERIRELQRTCLHPNGTTQRTGPRSDTEECPDCGLNDTWDD